MRVAKVLRFGSKRRTSAWTCTTCSTPTRRRRMKRSTTWRPTAPDGCSQRRPQRAGGAIQRAVRFRSEGIRNQESGIRTRATIRAMTCRSLVVLTILLRRRAAPSRRAGRRERPVVACRSREGGRHAFAGRAPEEQPGRSRPLYARAIVLENGVSTAALITVDAGASRCDLAGGDADRSKQELGIPAASVLLTATHTHSAGGRAGPITRRRSSSRCGSRKQKLTPARMGYGTGVSYINVNRQIIDPKTGRWWEGPNYEGPSDKTVAVLKFETPDGEPIAVYYNYAVHARALPGSSIRSAATSPARPRATSKTRSTTTSSPLWSSWRRRAIRIRSTTSRRTTCATSASRTTPSAASTSATRCRPAAKVSTGTIRPSRG